MNRLASRTGAVRLARAAAMLLVCGPLMGAVGGCSMLGMGGGHKPAEKMSGDARRDMLAEAGARAAQYPEEPYWPCRMGEVYAAMDSTDAAVAALRTALARDADYAPAISLLSRIQYASGEHAEAIAMLDGYIAAHPGAPDELRAALALHLDAVDEVERAEAAIAACTGNSGDVYAARTYLSLRGNAPASALTIAKAALDADGSAVNYNNYGVALLHAGRPIEARDAFRRALDRNASLAGALYNMSLIEVFYFFDESAGRQWFDRYTQVALEDPDDLASVFKVDMTRLSRPGATR
ncbi:MAG: tetratricopeptide repeat protein [Candidatus Krumholzibacteria bacterium]|nr:tetratricopeptide repeat protein [Candidatus Krumholzibacteria bacterium]MDH4337238.1 tetratricopeptide repeat protein [Candidatus Krumholzibacteria bacterium]MDH5268700.1 tetratricopeptide repeat protein [Candidatus Krumholzibacteria bacterium]